MVLAILLVSLLAVSVVSAEDNVTNDVVSVDSSIVTENSSKYVKIDNKNTETNDFICVVDEQNLTNSCNYDEYHENLNKLNSQELMLSSENDDYFISNSINEEILGDSLPFTISVSGDSSIRMGDTGTVRFMINYKEYDVVYNYNFVIDICDSYNNPILSNQYMGSADGRKTLALSYSINTGSLNPGTYTAKLRDGNNYNRVFATYKFKVYYQLFSVSVSDNSIEYKSNGKISMSISPTSISPYEYDYYMKICDSNGVVIYSQRYSGTGQSTVSQYYPIYSGPKTSSATITTLAPGTYIIKIINTYDKSVLDTAKLVMKPETPNSASSVSVEDTSINYKSGGNVNIYLSPVSGNYYKYDFYLKIYDSNNVEKISKRYNGECRGKNTLIYNIAPNTLSLGEYTLKVFNTTNNRRLDSAKLYMMDSGSSDGDSYSIDIDDTGDIIIYNWMSGCIPIKISCNSPYTSFINYSFQVAIYDSTNTLKMSSELYHGLINFDGSRNYEYLHHNIPSNSLDPGIYTVKIIKNGIIIDTSKFYINNPTKLIASDLTTVYNGNKYLTVNLIDEHDGIGMWDKSISVNLNGVKKIITNSNGQAKLSTNNLAPNTYYVTITFDGDTSNIKSTTYVKVIINKATPKLTAKSKTFKKSLKTKKYTVTLKTNRNKVMKNTKLTLKVNGKTYSAKTNAKGQATFKITKLTKKGKFNAVVTYKGNAYYNKLSKKVQIKIN